MDNATKRELKKQDQFVTTTQHGLAWANQNRRSAIVTAAVVLLVILAVVGGYSLYGYRSEKASAAFGTAMEVYQTPIAVPGQPVSPDTKTFATGKERAAAANAKFLEVANQYGMTPSGRIAKYFAGLTYMEQGQNQSAESTLKDAAGGWNGDVAALSKLALAQLYRDTNRNADAAKLYEELTKTDASTVPAGMAQIKLAEMYETQGKTDDAKKIYAQLKDKDKDAKGNPGPVGQLAASKLNPAPKL